MGVISHKDRIDALENQVKDLTDWEKDLKDQLHRRTEALRASRKKEKKLDKMILKAEEGGSMQDIMLWLIQWAKRLKLMSLGSFLQIQIPNIRNNILMSILLICLRDFDLPRALHN